MMSTWESDCLQHLYTSRGTSRRCSQLEDLSFDCAGLQSSWALIDQGLNDSASKEGAVAVQYAFCGGLKQLILE